VSGGGRALAKSGADILVISSAVGAASIRHDVNTPAYVCEPAALLHMWKARSNDDVHPASFDRTGNGVVYRSDGRGHVRDRKQARTLSVPA